MVARPLAGRTVLVAASEDRVGPLVNRLREQGANAIPFPTMRIVPAKDPGSLDEAIRDWASYDWVVFTSTNGVDAVVKRAKLLGVTLSQDRGKIAVVGTATRARAEAAGFKVDAMPDEYVTDAMPAVLGDVRGRRILLPRSRIARKALTVELRGRGADVVEVDAYEPIPASPDLSPIERSDWIDFVLITSAGVAQNMVSLLPTEVRNRVLSEAEAICIGPLAAEAARHLGFRVAAVSEEHTVQGLIDSLAKVSVHG